MATHRAKAIANLLFTCHVAVVLMLTLAAFAVANAVYRPKVRPERVQKKLSVEYKRFSWSRECRSFVENGTRMIGFLVSAVHTVGNAHRKILRRSQDGCFQSDAEGEISSSQY